MLTLLHVTNPVTRSSDRISSILSYQNGTNLLLRSGNSLLTYHMRNNSLFLTWEAADIFGKVSKASTGTDKYPFFIGDLLNTGNGNILIWRAVDGVRAASLRNVPANGNPFEIEYRRDNRFGDMYGFRQDSSIFLWDFFFGNSNSFGLFTRDEEGSPKIFILSKTALAGKQPTMFKEVKDVNAKLSSEWNDLENDVLLERMEAEDGPKDHFLLWGKGGLSIYKFEGKELKQILRDGTIQKNSRGDRLFVCNFGGSATYKDILLSSGDRLKVYKYNESRKHYSQVAPVQSTQPFWQERFASMAIIKDVTRDGKDELVYNGAEGITAVSFDHSTMMWTHNLATKSFGRPLGTVETSSLIFMDYYGDVRVGQIEKIAMITTTMRPASISTPGVETTTTRASVSWPRMETTTTRASVSWPRVETTTTRASVSWPLVETTTTRASVSWPRVETTTTPPSVSWPRVETTTTRASISWPREETTTRPASVSTPRVETTTTRASISWPRVETTTRTAFVSTPLVVTPTTSNSFSCPRATPFSPIDYPVEDNQAYSFEDNASSSIFLPLDTVGVTREPYLFWEDRWETSEVLKGTVDVQNSRARVTIPLAELRVSTELGYSVGMEYLSNEELGEDRVRDTLMLGYGGWSLISPVEAIVADRRSATLPWELPTFYVVNDGQYKKLEMDEDRLSNAVFNFTANLEEGGIWELVYNDSEEIWTAACSGKGESRIYGGEGATKSGLNWPFWIGHTGTDLGSLRSQVTMWYLKEREDTVTNKKLTFTYQTDLKNLPAPNQSISYTNSIQIQKIEDDRGNKIIFRYQEKPVNEYDAKTPVKNGKISLPVEEENKFYLKGLSITTSGYQQEFQFNYKVDGGKRKLEEVEQKNAANSFISIFQFKYGSTNQLENISGGKGSSPFSVKYSYGVVNIPVPSTVSISQAHIKQEINIGEDSSSVKTAMGEDFVGLAYKSSLGNSVNLKILDKHFDTVLTENVNFLTTAENPYGHRYVESFEVIALDECILIIEMLTKGFKEITGFCRPDLKTTNEWKKTWSSGRLDDKAKISFAVNSFGIVKNESSYVTIFTTISSSSPKFTQGPFKVTKIDTGSKIKHFALLSSNDVVVYNNGLTCYTKTSSGTWKPTTLVAFHYRENNWLDSLKIDNKTKKDISDRIESVRFQSTKNALLFLSFDYDGDELNTTGNLLLISGGKVKMQLQRISLNKQKMSEVKRDIDTDYGTLELEYERNWDRKWGATVKQLSGPKLVSKMKELLKEYYDYGDIREEFQRNLTRSFQEELDKRAEPTLLFNFQEIAEFRLSGEDENPLLYKLEDTKLTPIYQMNGHVWQRLGSNHGVDEKKVAKYPLGDDFKLQVANGSRNDTIYTLFTGKSRSRQLTSFEINVEQGGEAVIAYPKYIAYQNTNRSQIELFSLDKDSQEFERQTLSGEELIRGSDENWLVTLKNNKLRFRRPAEFLKQTEKRVRVLTGSEVSCGEHKMKRNFQTKYDWVRRHLIEKKVTMWYGESKSTSGWVEKITLEDTWSWEGNATKIDKWFNGKTSELAGSKSVELNYSQRKSDDEETPENEITKITDSTGNWQIADISPYSVEHDMFGFIGFEPYENATSWNYPRNKVVSNPSAFSLTGQSYLNLSGNEKLSRKFTPKDQWATYLVAGWIRWPAKVYSEKGKAILIKIGLQPGGFHLATVRSEVKRELGNGWTYLEALVDLQVYRKLYNEIYYKKKAEVINEVVSGDAVGNSTISLNMPKLSNAKMVLKIEVSPVRNEIIEVDHIRFFPFSSDFIVNVFKDSAYFSPPEGQEQNNQNKLMPPVQAMIVGNGGVMNKMYGETDIIEIGTFTETGKVDQFTSTGKWAGGKSVLTLSPEEGFYETFEEQFFKTKWQLSHGNTFKIKKGQLWHESSSRTRSNDRIIFKSENLNGSAFRLRYHFDDLQTPSEISLNWRVGSSQRIKITLEVSSSQSKATLACGSNIQSFIIVPSGEIIAYLEEGQGWLFIDGSLIREFSTPTENFSSFFIDFKGNGRKQIKDLIVLYKPEMTMQYFNIWGQQIQTIRLETVNSAQVSATVYDVVGREAIRTKASRFTRNVDSSCLLCFHSNFVTNGLNPASANSVFKTGRLEGLVSRLNPEDEGYPYSRTVYEATPLQQKLCEGQPGKRYSCGEPNAFATTTPQNSGIDRLFNLFPPSKGFKEKVEKKPNGSIFVTILNTVGQEVAHYVHVAGFNHILSTNEFDKSGKITRILPPLYHEKANTMERATEWKFGESTDDFTQAELSLQRKLATKFSYDDKGNMIKKETADSKPRHYLYDEFGNKRFSYFLSGNQTTAENVAYYLYTEQNNVAESGALSEPLTERQLKQYIEVPFMNKKKPFQQIEYYEMHSDPELRGKLRTITTFNEKRGNGTSNEEHEIVMETVRFNSDDLVEAKKITSTTNPEDKSYLARKFYKGGRISKIVYPSTSLNGDRLHLLYSYDKAGNLLGLGTPQDPFYFAKYTWIPGGIIKEEEVRPSSSATCDKFKRTFRYDSPGHLIEISDPFLTEKLDYVENGYGQGGFGEGIVMKTSFNATWAHNQAYSPWFEVQTDGLNLIEYDENICIGALKRLGYLSNSSIYTTPLKVLKTSDFPQLPGRCRGQTGVKLSNMLKIKLPPSENYGHMYAYGNHKELTQAKYFDTSDLQLKPLTSKTFSDYIAGITPSKSEDIWRVLKSANVFTTNQSGNDKSVMGKGFPGNVVDEMGIASELNKAEANLGAVVEPILNFILKRLEAHQPSLEDFEDVLNTWKGGKDVQLPRRLQTNLKKSAEVVFNFFKNRGYLTQNKLSLDKLLNPNFLQAIGNQQLSPRTTKKVVDLLLHHFKNQLGENPFDLESYNIDANGNHREFTVGEKRFKFIYEDETNKISEIHESIYGDAETPHVVHKISHDDHGNMKEAPHHKIKSILYHPVSNRPTQIDLEDGKVLSFEYDGAGERSRKYLRGPDGKMIYELHYFRDEKGKILSDHRLEYDENEIKKETKTIYIYGARGYVLGFLRNGKFYSVHTDGSGSTRLVTKAGKVVAAYDYLPYGEFMRKFGTDPEGQIMILYTGQEYDEETGLYNFHARLYDPLIGRFLQMDPMGQLFSPYAYAGNSPISYVDPDGQFIFLLTSVIVGAVVGAYLGGAAANGTYNPFEWKWNQNTLFGMLGGALTGALIPVGLGAAAASAIGLKAAIGIGVAVAGINIAATAIANPGINFWDPKILFAGFQGFGTGVGLVGGVGTLHGYAGKLGTIGKALLLTTSYGLGGGLAYHKVAQFHNGNYKFWEWNKILEPGSVMAMLEGFDTGTGWPMALKQVGKGAFSTLKRLSKTKPAIFLKTIAQGNRVKVGKLLKQMRNAPKVHKALKNDLIKATSVVLMTYYQVAAANGEFDPTKWDLTKFSTYEAALNGVFFGKDVKNMLKHIRENGEPLQWSNPVFNKLAKKTKNYLKKLGSNVSKKLFNSQIKKAQQVLNNPAFLSAVKAAMSGTTPAAGAYKSSPTVPKQAADFLTKVQVARNTAEESKTIFKNADLDNAGSISKIRNDEGDILKLENDDSNIRRYLEEQGTCGGGSRRKRSGRGHCSTGRKKSEVSDKLFENENPEIINKIENQSSSGSPKKAVLVTYEPTKAPSDADDVIHRFKKLKIDGFIDQKLSSLDQHHSFSLRDKRNKADVSFAETLAMVFSEIPTRTMAQNEFSIAAIKGMMDGGSFDKTGEIMTYQTKLTLPDATTVDFLHAYKAYIYKGKQSLKSVVSVEERKIPRRNKNPDGGVEHTDKQDSPSRTELDIEKSITDHMREQGFTSDKFDSMVYIIYKKRPKNQNENVQTHVLVMSPELSRHSRITPEFKSLAQIESAIKFRDWSNQDLKIAFDPNDIYTQHWTNAQNVDLSYAKGTTAGIENFLKTAVESFNERVKIDGNPKVHEEFFQGYVYGLLRLTLAENFKLTVRPEMATGKGYADIVVVKKSTPGKNNWAENVPVIIELKYTSNSRGSHKVALDQVLDRGYANNLFLKHSSKYVGIVTANPLIRNGPKVSSTVELIPPKQILADVLKQAAFTTNDHLSRKELKDKIQATVNWAGSTISPDTYKFGAVRDYLTSELIGQFSRTLEGGRTYIVNKNIGVTDLLVKWPGRFIENDKSLYLHIVENVQQRPSNKIDSNTKYKIPEDAYNLIRTDQLTVIGIEVNPFANKVNEYAGEVVVKRGIDAFAVQSGAKMTNAKPLPNFDADSLLQNNRDAWNNFFDNYHKNLKDIMPAEHNVQALLHGLFERSEIPGLDLNNNEIRSIRDVYMELNTGSKGRLDLAVRDYQVDKNTNLVVDGSQKLAVAEVKLTKAKKGNTEDSIKRIVAEAQNQLENYDGLSIGIDADKVSKFTVVFDQNGRSQVEMNEALIDHPSRLASPHDSSFDEESSGRGLRRKREAFNQSELIHHGQQRSPVSSGSASIHSGLWLVSTLRSFAVGSMDRIKNLMEPFTSKSVELQTQNSLNSVNYHQENKANSRNQGGDNIFCQPGAWNGDFYNMDAITCKNMDGSSTAVFYKLGRENDDEIMKTGYQRSPFLYKDNYSISSCKSIEFNGIPSVTCSGEKTDFVYTPERTYFNKTFDNLDAQIMLGAVVLNKLGSFFSPLFKKDKILNEEEEKRDEEVEVGEEMLSTFKGKYDEIREILSDIEAKDLASNVDWAKHNLEDILEEISKNEQTTWKKNKVEVLEERLTALYDDLLEEIEVMVENIPQGEGQLNSQTGGNADNINVDWSSLVNEVQNIWKQVSDTNGNRHQQIT